MIFDDYVRLRIFLIDGFGFGDDFLNEGHVEAVGECKTARTGDGQTDRLVASTELFQFLVDVGQQSGHSGAHIRVVTPIIGEQRVRERVGLIEHHRLHSSGTDIKTYTQRLCAVRFGHGFCCFNHVSTSIVLVRRAAFHGRHGSPYPGYPIM